jgi:glycosyltransferase involved in cell wall biosynthesis
VTRTVSVIIPTYNYGRFVAEAIESALGQTRPPVEVIVVDDGSTDETADVVRRFGERVRYIRQENLGVCAARNRGVAESSGEFIAFLDADDTWEPMKLEKQIAVFESDAEIGLVHCGMREFDSDTGETIALHVEGQRGWIADELLLWERPAIVGPGGTIMVRRDVFDAVGGFDERMRVSEDWDFCYLVARGHKVGFVGEPLVNYRSHPAAAHRDVRELELGMSHFYQKAFAAGDVSAELKDRAMGNFHRTLAGSYFHAGDYASFIKHAFKSIYRRPASLGYFLKFPFRWLK